jgi:hypothetical protein
MRKVTTCVLALFLFACGDDSRPAFDAGRVDAGRSDGGFVRQDAGGGTDAGSGTDAGDVDAGEMIDAGGKTDAGPGTDAGGGTDAGFDSGVDAGMTCPGADLGMMLGESLATGTTAGAGEVIGASCGSAGGPDATFRWTAPRAGNFLFDTNGSAYDTVLTVTAADCAGMEVACDDDQGAGTRSRIALPMVASGTVFVVTVQGYDGASGDFVLNITEGTDTETACGDMADDDRDGDVDCDDLDCETDAACSETGAECADMLDNDGDGDADCEDFDCVPESACREIGAECIDMLDNDGDMDIDCADFDCESHVACSETDAECAGGVDNDGDGDIDCADSDCEGMDACAERGAECTGGVDDDADMDVDCADSDCLVAPACDTCADQNLMMMMGMAVATGDNSTAEHHRQPSCGGDGGLEIAFEFTPPMTGEYTISTAGSAYDTVLAVLDGCNGGEIACDDDVSFPADPTSIVTVPLAMGHPVIILLDAYDDTETGMYTLNITVTAATYSQPTTAGELVITEIGSNASGGTETNREWFEVWNPTSTTFDVSGCVLRDSSATGMATIPAGTLIRPDQFAVFGQSATGFTPTAGFTFSLANASDSVRIECGAMPVVIDRVAWDDSMGWPSGSSADGLSQNLDPGFSTDVLNDDPRYWCGTPAFVGTYNGRDIGTPFQPNASCF